MERGGSKNGQVGNIWDVVIYLARALTDARDQLVGLINCPGYPVASDRKMHKSQLRQFKGISRQRVNEQWERENGYQDVRVSNALARCRGGGPNLRDMECRAPAMREMECGNPASSNLKNVHRDHARGHVAFGVHSQYKPQPPSHKAANRSNGRGSSAGSKYRRGARKKGVEIGLFLDPKSNCLQINTKKGEENPVKIKFVPTTPCQPSQPSQPCPPLCVKDSLCNGPSSPDSKRHCIGTQYAELLREEAFSIRERRLAEDLKPDSKPKWTRC